MGTRKPDRRSQIIAAEMRKGAALLRLENIRDLGKQSSADFIERWADAIETGKPLDFKAPKH